jgi:hypothetical protein
LAAHRAGRVGPEPYKSRIHNPSYRDSDIETTASLLPFPIDWHHGFRLHVDLMAKHPNFRSPAIIDAGSQI